MVEGTKLSEQAREARWRMRYNAPFPCQSGEPFRVASPSALRIGHEERDAAASDLGDHYVAGRLTLEELHDRLGAVFAAKTYGQLARIMADLPGLRKPAGQPGPARPAWAGVYWPPATFPPPVRDNKSATPSDRAGRVAAVALLVLAMTIWLFTALIFARHGMYYYHQYQPPGPGTWGPP
jgi:hypothetical protein